MSELNSQVREEGDRRKGTGENQQETLEF